MEEIALKNILEKMLLIRTFEDCVADVAEKQEVLCPVHLYTGQEAIAAAVCEALAADDFVYSTHRSHGHYLAKGGSVDRLMAEIYCRTTGCSSGRGGSMHVIDRSVNFMGSSAIVAGSIPLAVGSALAAKLQATNQVSVPFFGDGATDEGVFYECVNFSMLYDLPVVFICENNGFSTHMPGFLRQSNPEVASRLKGFKIMTKKIDGNNPIEIYSVAQEMVERARLGGGPALIEVETYRWLSHVGYWRDLDVGYRKKTDVESWMKRCPINSLFEYLQHHSILTVEEFEDLKLSAGRKVASALLFAKNSPPPSPNDLINGLFADNQAKEEK